MDRIHDNEAQGAARLQNWSDKRRSRNQRDGAQRASRTRAAFGGSMLFVAVAFLFSVVLVSCARFLPELTAFGTDVAKDCAPGALSDYNDVQSAVHNGGANWLSVVFDAIGCVEPVVMDELRAHGVIAIIDTHEIDRLTELFARTIDPVIEAGLRSPRATVHVDWRALLTEQSIVAVSDLVASTSEPPATSPAVSPAPRVSLARGELVRAMSAIALERAIKQAVGKIKLRQRK